jgi:hypothetical protein
LLFADLTIPGIVFMVKRTREHVIADLSVNFLERQVLRRGHVLDRIAATGDYGTDALMRPFSATTGRREGVLVGFQLKATDHLRFVKQQKFVVCRVDTAHLREWCYVEDYPFILVLYDAQKHRAFWLDVHQYIKERGVAEEDEDLESVTLRIPAGNKLTVNAIDRFHRLSLSYKEDLKLLQRD